MSAISGCGGGGGTPTNSFVTMNAPFGTDPVATSPTDTLNFTSSNSSVTITGNSGTKTLDFTAAGTISGSGTANHVTKWTGASSIGDSGLIITAGDQLQLVAGTVGTPGLVFGTDTTTGWYRPSANLWNFSASGIKQASIGGNALTVFDVSNASNNISLSADNNGINITGPATSGRNQLGLFTLSPDGGGNLSWGNLAKGTNWVAYTIGTGEEIHTMELRNAGGTGNYPMTIGGADDAIVLGYSSGTALNAPTVQVISKPDESNIGGTTTANAATAITGTSTHFGRRVGLGDRLALSSASTTYATVKSITDATHLTVDAALGNGTSQTILLKHAPFLWSNSGGTNFMLLNDQGRLLIGNVASVGGPLAQIQVDNGSGVNDIAQFRDNNVLALSVIDGGHTVLGGGATASELRFLEPSGSGTNYTAFKAAAQAADLTYTLPTAYPTVSGQVLASTTAGVMSWASGGGGGGTPGGADTNVQFNDGGSTFGGQASFSFIKATTSLNLLDTQPSVNITSNDSGSIAYLTLNNNDASSTLLLYSTGSLYTPTGDTDAKQIVFFADAPNDLLIYNTNPSGDIVFGTGGATPNAHVRVSQGNIILGGDTVASEFRFLEPSGSGSNYTAFKAQAQAADLTYTLPAAYPTSSGQMLASTTAGVMSWASGGGASTSVYEQAILNDSPLGYWRLGEASGTIAADDSGNGNDGTYENAPTLGEYGAIYHDLNTAITLVVASNQFVQVSSGSPWNFEFSDPFSLEIWVKTNTVSDERLISKLALTPNVRGYELVVNGGSGAGVPAMQLLNNSGGPQIIVAGSTPINDGKWHHVVGTYNGNGLASGINLYVDGTPEVNNILADNLASNTIISAADLSFGAIAGTGSLEGSIDEVAVYGAELTAAQIAEHFLQGGDPFLTILAPGGAAGNVQFNSGGVAFGGVNAFAYNESTTNPILTLAGDASSFATATVKADNVTGLSINHYGSTYGFAPYQNTTRIDGNGSDLLFNSAAGTLHITSALDLDITTYDGGSTGHINIKTGNGSPAASGNITITGGSASGGNQSANIIITAGGSVLAGGLPGTISFLSELPALTYNSAAVSGSGQIAIRAQATMDNSTAGCGPMLTFAEHTASTTIAQIGAQLESANVLGLHFYTLNGTLSETMRLTGDGRLLVPGPGGSFTNYAANIDQINGVIRSRDSGGTPQFPTGGAGIEMFFLTTGVIQSYDRTGSTPIVTTINPAGGAVSINAAYTLPTADGAAGYAIITNGAGVCSFGPSPVGTITIDTSPISGGTAGRVLFESATNKVSEDAGLTYDATGNVLDSSGGFAVGGTPGISGGPGIGLFTYVGGLITTASLTTPVGDSTYGPGLYSVTTQNGLITAAGVTTPLADGSYGPGLYSFDISNGIVTAAGVTTPVADGTYTVGLGGTTNGTITITNGIITAIQQAS